MKLSISSSTRGSNPDEGGDVHSAPASVDTVLPGWAAALPPEYALLYELMNSTRKIKIVASAYAIFTIFLIINYAFYLVADVRDGVPTSETLYFLSRLQDVFYASMPFVAYYYFKAFYADKDVALLFSSAVQIDKRLPLLCTTICRVNLILLTISFILFAIFTDRILVKVLSSIYSVLYLYPFCFTYSLCVCIMLAHRVHAVELCRAIKRSRDKMPSTSGGVSDSDPDNVSLMQNQVESAEDRGDDLLHLYLRYRQVHVFCLRTSEEQGAYFMLMYMLAVVFAVTTVWSIYIGDRSLLAAVGYFCITIFVLFQLGWSQTASNEAGHVACRELASYVLCRDELFYSANDESANKMGTLLLGCINYAKIEVFFFGNFALRTRHLVAILGSLVASIIPAAIKA